MRTFRCQKYLVAAVLIFTSLVADAQITIVGTIDCGSWVSSRKASNQLMQEWVLGLINGLAFGTAIEIWGCKWANHHTSKNVFVDG